MSFTTKQALFVDSFCSAQVNCNATEAARRAGYKGSESTLGTIAFENMQKPAIRAEIDKRLAAAFSWTKVTIEKVLCDIETARIAAMAARQYGSAIRCCELQGRYLGMWNPKPFNDPPVEEMSLDELIQLLREVDQKGELNLAKLLARDDPT